jgi:L-ribulose-5-phosphate 3-epimerase
MASDEPAYRLGYNTNGFPFHRLEDAIDVLASLGYRGVALTPDVHHLDPYRTTSAAVAAVRRRLERSGLSCVVETGARFLLDPKRKHWPTLLSSRGADARAELLERCLGLAADLGAPVVSFWSGASEAGGFDANVDLLCARTKPLLDRAAKLGVTMALEPEPGMLVGDLDAFRRLDAKLADPRLALTLDVGHAWLTEAESPADCLRQWASRVRNVHLDDVRRPVHEHLAFGDGEIEFAPVMRALRGIRFAGLASVELSRHGHEAPAAAARAFAFLEPLVRA